jgi:nicotinate-nucleotide adenylyltransferase
MVNRFVIGGGAQRGRAIDLPGKPRHRRAMTTGSRTDASRRRELAYPGMRIGLFGGSFNPAHHGHAHVAETALRRLGLDRVWWLATPQNPLKDPRETAPLAQRLANARAFARGRRMVVSDLESRWGVRFSIDLIERLRARYPGVTFVWVMGSDNLLNFHAWRRWRRVVEAVPIAFVARPGAQARARFSKLATAYRAHRRPADALVRSAPPAWTYLNAPLVPLSSTALRRLGARGRA